MAVAPLTDDVATCPNCGEPNAPRFRLCGFSGASLGSSTAADQIRGFVTVVNSDLKGSTALGERLDPESLREVLTRYFDEMLAEQTSAAGPQRAPSAPTRTGRFTVPKLLFNLADAARARRANKSLFGDGSRVSAVSASGCLMSRRER